jgi:hypothetical protein
MATVISGAQVSPSGYPGPNVKLPRGYISGLILANGTDAANDIIINTGECRDDTNTSDIWLAAGLTKQVDAAWAAGTNAGGRDTGAVANGTWNIFAIAKADGTSDVLMSLSYSAPTMPSGYIYKRRVGSIVRMSGAFVAFYHRDNNYFFYSNPIADLSAAAHSTGQVASWPLSVPAFPNGTFAHVVASTANSVDYAIVLVRSPSSGNYTSNVCATRAAHRANIELQIWTNNLAQILVWVETAAASSVTSIWLTTLGYWDSREI